MISNTNLDNVDFEVVNPDSFFNDLNLTDWQELFRVPGLAQATLERQMLLSMADCNLKLADWKDAQVLAGIGFIPEENETDYAEAVESRALAFLIQITPALAMDERARDALEELGQTPDAFFRRSDMRLARITGESAGRGGVIAVVG